MLSVIIIAQDEEHNINNCLASVTWADEIIVLDSGSSDNTVNIAKQYTDRVYQTDWQGYGVQKQRALSKATGDWVLNIDADEIVTEGLKAQLIEKINADDADAYRIPIQMYFYNKALKHSSSPERHIRLFKRRGAYFSDDIVHEGIVLPEASRIGQLSEALAHNSFRDLSHALYKLNKYSSYTAQMRIQSKQKPRFGKTLLASLWMFMRCYIIQRGFLDGREGLLFAAYAAQGSFYRGMKLVYPDKKHTDFKLKQ